MDTYNDNKSILPKHLEELVKPTQGSFAKLSAAWVGLSVETQIIILNYCVSNKQIDSMIGICKLAIESNNEYVQYLGVKYGFRLDDAIKEFVAVSNNSLLAVFKNAYLKCRINPENLFRLDHGERIELISKASDITIFALENILQYYYSNTAVRYVVSKTELEEIVVEFMNNTNVMDEVDSFDILGVILRLQDVCDEEIISIIDDMG